MNRNHTKTVLILILFILTYTANFAQNSNKTDSLKNLLKTVNKKDKTKLLNELAKEYLPNFPQKANRMR